MECGAVRTCAKHNCSARIFRGIRRKLHPPRRRWRRISGFLSTCLVGLHVFVAFATGGSEGGIKMVVLGSVRRSRLPRRCLGTRWPAHQSTAAGHGDAELPHSVRATPLPRSGPKEFSFRRLQKTSFRSTQPQPENNQCTALATVQRTRRTRHIEDQRSPTSPRNSGRATYGPKMRWSRHGGGRCGRVG